MPVSATYDPNAFVSLLRRACATSWQSANTQSSLSLISANGTTISTVLTFAIVDDLTEYDIILGRAWKAWTELNNGEYQ
jgi:hypothetical protein